MNDFFHDIKSVIFIGGRGDFYSSFSKLFLEGILSNHGIFSYVSFRFLVLLHMSSFLDNIRDSAQLLLVRLYVDFPMIRNTVHPK
jgi:hypothetical protein